MSVLDAVAVALVVLGALYGLWKGAVRQVVGVLAWIAAFVVPFLLAGRVAHALQPTLDTSYTVAFIFCSLGLALLSNILTRILGTWLLRKLVRRSDDPEDEDEAPIPAAVDHAAGALVGAVAMASVTWVLMSLAALVAEGLENHGRRPDVLEAEVVQLARRYNVVGFATAGRLDDVKRALAPVKALPTAKAAEARAALEKDPRFRAIAKDPAIVKALQAGDTMAVARSAELLSLVSDPEAMERVATVVRGLAAEAEAAVTR